MLSLLLLLVAPPTHVVELNGHRFTLPAGFAVELTVPPGRIKFPVAAAFDPAGNLYVTEASGTNENVQKQLKDLPHRVWKLPAGRFDAPELLADKLMLPQGVMWHDGAVYVGAPPTITRFRDGERSVWHDGKSLTGCANDLHGPYAGIDGWVYWTKGAFAEQTFDLPTGKPFRTKAAHIYRARPDGTGREPVFAAGMDNPVDVVSLPSGERFVAGTFLQHPADGKRDGLIHAVYGGVWGKDHAPVNGHPWTAPALMPPMTHLGPAAPSGLHRYDSATFGPEFTDNLFCTQFNLRKVSRHVLVEDGATFRTLDSDFLVSDSLDFHPTDVIEDRNGSLIVVDTGGWYKLCCPTSQLVKPDVPGAIYRVKKVGAMPAKRPPSDELQAVWDASRIELRKAGDGLRYARAALDSADERVRIAACHVVGLYRDKAAVPRLLELVIHSRPGNRRAAAEALGRIGDPAAVPALLEAHIGVTDRVLQHSLTYALIEIGDPKATAAGLTAENPDVQRAALVALDGMGASQPGPVLDRLAAANDHLHRSAWWVAGRHTEWGEQIGAVLAAKLRNPDLRHDDALFDGIGRLAHLTVVQGGLTDALHGSRGQQTAALLALSRSKLSSWPAPLWAAVVQRGYSEFTFDYLGLAIRTIPPTDDQLAALRAELPERERKQVMGFRRPGGRLAAADFGWTLAGLSRDADYRPLAVATLVRGGLSADQLTAVADALPRAAVTDLSRLLDLFDKAPEPVVRKLLAVVAADAGLQKTVRPERVRQLTDKASDAVKAAAAPVLATLEAGLADQRAKLEALVAELPTGDVRRGQQVFNGPKAVCISCHQMGYVGGKAGPDLTRIGGIRGERDLLEAIVYPSASFVRSYEPVTAITLDGRTVSGVLRADEPAAVVIAVSATEEVRIPRGELEVLRPGTVSLMPTGFDQQLTRQELADLVAFLKAAR